METNKVLDLSMAPDQEYEAIKNGFDLFLNNVDRHRYFGYVDKDELKDICERFDYTDMRSFGKGIFVGVASAIVGGIAYRVYKNKKAKPEEEN